MGEVVRLDAIRQARAAQRRARRAMLEEGYDLLADVPLEHMPAAIRSLRSLARLTPLFGGSAFEQTEHRVANVLVVAVVPEPQQIALFVPQPGRLASEDIQWVPADSADCGVYPLHLRIERRAGFPG
jgi:hypothetical protein